jgi:tripeptidyl-peptidase-1
MRQYTVGVATGVPVNFLSVGDNTTDGDLDGFLDTVNFMLTLDTLPTVMTTSYGPDEDLVSREMAYKLCDAIAAITVQGVSVLFATGDAGVGHNEGDCSAGEAFVAQFPSGCP